MLIYRCLQKSSNASQLGHGPFCGAFGSQRCASETQKRGSQTPTFADGGRSPMRQPESLAHGAFCLNDGPWSLALEAFSPAHRPWRLACRPQSLAVQAQRPKRKPPRPERKGARPVRKPSTRARKPLRSAATATYEICTRFTAKQCAKPENGHFTMPIRLLGKARGEKVERDLRARFCQAKCQETRPEVAFHPGLASNRIGMHFTPLNARLSGLLAKHHWK